MDELARSIVPLVALIAGLAVGWFRGQPDAPSAPPAEEEEVCDHRALEAEMDALRLEVGLLKAEVEEVW